LHDQETRNDGGTPFDSTVNGAFCYHSMKDDALGMRDVRCLLSVQKQLASEEIREVRVTWVDSSPDPPVTNI
jgi:hypothetical protein